ncbi:hypothetical protein [Chelativorans composti]|uniref:Secreted protein n=1 Tax=Chelativorans composti TaxID=768533 RepID=A0ABW5DDM2_9HYPH
MVMMVAVLIVPVAATMRLLGSLIGLAAVMRLRFLLRFLVRPAAMMLATVAGVVFCHRFSTCLLGRFLENGIHLASGTAETVGAATGQARSPREAAAGANLWQPDPIKG